MNDSLRFRVATRGSALATTQSTQVMDDVVRLSGLSGELSIVKTQGDVVTAPLAQLGGTGVFVSAVRDALVQMRADLAVHSLKDLPTAPCDGLRIASIPVREDPRDALCARDGLTLETLPEGARIGTGSPRRAAQLRAARADLRVEAIRGNVDTRLSRVKGISLREDSNAHMSGGKAEDLDAVVLAAAGLHRVGREEYITELMGTGLMLPAPGQGALAVEVREADDPVTLALKESLAAYDDEDTRVCVSAERMLLRELEAGCSAPVGALAAMNGSMLELDASVIGVDGNEVMRTALEMDLSGLQDVHERTEAGRELGREAARKLLKFGAASLMT